MSDLLDGVFRRLLAHPAPEASRPAPETAIAEDEPQDQEQRDELRLPARDTAMLEWIDQDDVERAQAVHLLDRTENGIGVRTPIPLAPGWPVLLTLSAGPPLKAVVKHRRRDTSGWVLGLQQIRLERRRFDRRPMDRTIALSWQGLDGRSCEASGRVRDVGEGGLRFVTTVDIPFRASVRMAIEGWQRFGTIVHVHPDRETRMYGVQFSGPPVLQCSPDFE